LRERQLKGWSRRKKEALIKGDWNGLERLSRAHGSTGSP
jgi:predicted GIY-YIG superfamily endonuclease